MIHAGMIISVHYLCLGWKRVGIGHTARLLLDWPACKSSFRFHRTSSCATKLCVRCQNGPAVQTALNDLLLGRAGPVWVQLQDLHCARPEVYIEEEAAGKDQGHLPFKRSSPLTTVISLWQWKEVAHTKEAEANYIIIYYSYYEPSWNMMNHLKPRNLPDHLYAHQRAATGAFFESLFQRLEPLESKNFASLLPGCNRRVCVYDLVLKFYRVFFLMLFSCLRFSVFLDVWKQITNWIRFFSVSLPVTRQIELQERRMHLASAASGEEGYLEMINDLDTALLP